MVRKVVIRSTHRQVGYHSSRKSGGAIPWESQNEQAYLQWLEVDPNVLSFESQPRTFKWSDFRYTPDALVNTYEGSFFAEVKPDEKMKDPDVRGRLAEVARRLLADNLDFRVVLKSQIFAQPLRSNVVEIYRYARFNLSECERGRMVNYNGPFPVEFGKLEEALGQDARRLILRFVAVGELSIELGQEIQPNSLISIPKHKELRHGAF